MNVMARDPADPAGVEWHADRHDFYLPELPAPVEAPAGARLLVHRLAVRPVSPQHVDEVLAAARACLAEAGKVYQQALTERAAIEDTAREVAGQRAMVEAHAQELRVMRARVARDQAALDDARAAQPARPARLRPRSRRPRAAVSDTPGQNLRPDPAAAQSPAELIGALRRFRAWAGNPSYRDMAQGSGQRAGGSTMHKALRGKELPARLEVIDAIVEGCGGGEEDRQRFATAWRRLTMGSPAGQALPPGPPQLRAVPPPSLPPEARGEAGISETATGEA